MRILIVTLITLVGTAWQQKVAVKQVEFSKVSRGYEEHIRVDTDSVVILVHDMKKDKPAVTFSRAIEEQEWVSLIKSLDSVKVSEIERLPSPGIKRASDAAMHGTITIDTGDGKSYSHGFDNEDPHDKLKPLIKTLRQISGRKQDQ